MESEILSTKISDMSEAPTFVSCMIPSNKVMLLKNRELLTKLWEVKCRDGQEVRCPRLYQ